MYFNFEGKDTLTKEKITKLPSSKTPIVLILFTELFFFNHWTKTFNLVFFFQLVFNMLSVGNSRLK